MIELPNTEREAYQTDWVFVEGKEGWETSNVKAYRITVIFDGLVWWQSHEWWNKDDSSYKESFIRSIPIKNKDNYNRIN